MAWHSARVGRQGAEEEDGRELGRGKEKNPKGKSHFHSSYLLRSPVPCGRGALCMLEI